MKRKKMFQTVFAVLLGAAVLSACGKSGGANSWEAAYDTAASTASYDAGDGYLISNGVVTLNEMAEAEELAEEYDVAETGNGVTKEQQDALAGRKLIKNVDLNVETEEFDALLQGIDQRVAALDGYIESIDVNNRNFYISSYNGSYRRSAYMTIRIPKDNLDTFLSAVENESNVMNRTESVTDVTLQYVDLESHKKALVAEQDRLLELIEQAETVEDIITIEGRLSDVRYQIESMESQLRTYDNKIDYSTVNLSVKEVEQYTPTDETTVGQRISSGFMNSLSGVGRDITNFVVWFVVNLPYLVVCAVIIVVVILIMRAVFKAAAKRRAKRKLQKVNPYQTQNAQQEQSEDGSSAENNNTNDNHTES